MQSDYWLTRWETSDTRFHEGKPNENLTENFHHLNLAANSRILVPLCGKSFDMVWFLQQGHRVVGVELSEIAAQEFFAEQTELGLTPEITTLREQPKVVRYSAPNIDIFVGDIFELDIEWLGQVDAIYDRAAMIALPDAMRQRYTALLKESFPSVNTLLVSLEYNPDELKPPPFPIDESGIAAHYGQTHDLQLLQRTVVEGGIKGVCEGCETIWLLSRR